MSKRKTGMIPELGMGYSKAKAAHDAKYPHIGTMQSYSHQKWVKKGYPDNQYTASLYNNIVQMTTYYQASDIMRTRVRTMNCIFIAIVSAIAVFAGL